MNTTPDRGPSSASGHESESGHGPASISGREVGAVETVREEPPPGPGLIAWDWREQPDLDHLGRLLLGFGVHLTKVDTESDEYAIVLSAVPLSDVEAYAIYAHDYLDGGS